MCPILNSPSSETTSFERPPTTCLALGRGTTVSIQLGKNQVNLLTVCRNQSLQEPIVCSCHSYIAHFALGKHSELIIVACIFRYMCFDVSLPFGRMLIVLSSRLSEIYAFTPKHLNIPIHVYGNSTYS